MCSTLSCALQKHSRLGHAIVLSLLIIPLAALHDLTALGHKSKFQIYNNSHSTLIRLYISNSGQNFWNQDILDQNNLSAGQSLQISVDSSFSNQCLYDIYGVFENNQTFEDYQVNLCSQSQYFLSQAHSPN